MFYDFLALVSGGVSLRGFSSLMYTPLLSLLLPLPQLAGLVAHSSPVAPVDMSLF